MRTVLKYTIISFVFASFIMFGNMNQVKASEVSQTDTNMVCLDGQFINDYTSLSNYNNEYYINYVNNTIYSEEINAAVDNWNVFELVNIVESESNITLTIQEQDLGSNGSIATYTIDDCSRKIVVNLYYFNDLTYNEKVMVISHELGHALGLVDLDPNLGYQSIMNSQFDSNNRVTMIDALMLVNILNLDENNFGSEYYFDVMNLCFADANDDGLSCIGGGGGRGSSSTTPSATTIVTNYVNDIQSIIGHVNNRNIYYAQNKLLNFYPSWMMIDHDGAYVLGVYASLGGLVFGGNLIPIGGTLGIQIVYDSLDVIAFQIFIGSGIHLLPHAEVTIYTMYLNGYVLYTDLEGIGFSVSGTISNWGVATSISLDGEITGVGMSYTIVSVDLGLPVNLVAEVVYTETIYSTDN
jgi:hypothetical protein